MISINSKRTPPPPHQGTFNHRLTQAGRLLTVFAASLSLTACPSPNATPKPKAWHVTTFAGGGSGGIDGIGPAASFESPYGIAQSGDTLYVTDGLWHSIRTIDTTTARVGTIVNHGPDSGAYAEGNGTVARFKFPRGIVAAGGDTFYVADLGNHRIREVRAGANAADTEVSLLAGTKDPGHRNGAGNTAQFNFPEGLALSGRTLYVADKSNHRIRAIDLAAKTVSPIAGNGTDGGFAEGAGRTTARFYTPSGLAVSGTTLYVADMNNHRIRAINLASGANNTVSTIAGNGKNDKVVDGPGATAQFNKPIGLAVSGSTLYVADSENHRIRAIDLANANYTVSTIAGDGTAKNTDGIGTAAQFSEPTGIAVSGSTLYVTSGPLIRKLEYR